MTNPVFNKRTPRPRTRGDSSTRPNAQSKGSIFLLQVLQTGNRIPGPDPETEPQNDPPIRPFSHREGRGFLFKTEFYQISFLRFKIA